VVVPPDSLEFRKVPQGELSNLSSCVADSIDEIGEYEYDRLVKIARRPHSFGLRKPNTPAAPRASNVQVSRVRFAYSANSVSEPHSMRPSPAPEATPTGLQREASEFPATAMQRELTESPGDEMTSAGNRFSRPTRTNIIPMGYLRPETPAAQLRKLLLHATIQRTLQQTAMRAVGDTAFGVSSMSVTAPYGDGPEQLPDGPLLAFDRFDEDAALAHIASAELCYLRPTGEIDVAEVLLRVFLFLPIRLSTMMTVSRVSRAWRAASLHQPQWCLLKPLFWPNEEMIMEAQTRCILAPLALPVHVMNRDEFLQAMRARYRVQQTFQQRLQRIHDRALLIERGWATVAQIIFTLCLIAVWVLVVHFAALAVQKSLDEGFRTLPEQEKVSADETTGVMSFFVSFFFVCARLASMSAFRIVFPAITAYQRGVRCRTAIAMFGLVVALTMPIGTPLGLVSVRQHQAATMASEPRIVYGLDSGRCEPAVRVALDARPAYVQIANANEWTVRPWAEGQTEPRYRLTPANATNATMYRPLCSLANATTQAWAEWLASNRSQSEQCWEAFVPPLSFDDTTPAHYDDNAPRAFQAFAFVLLYPPASVFAACPGAGPLAVPVDSGQASLMEWAVELGRGEWHGAAEQGSLTTLRTALDRPWFRTPWAHEMGWAWYSADGSNATLPSWTPSWYVDSAAAQTRLWLTSRIPLVLPYAVKNPAALQRAWYGRLWALLAIVIGLSLVVTAAVVAPPRVLSSKKLHVAVGVLVGVATCPLWFVIWGGICAFNHLPKVCMMNPDAALVLFILGIVISSIAALVVTVLSCCCPIAGEVDE
jgi:hypothetical protein